MIDKIYNADFLEFIKTIPDKYVDCVITDPPYKQEAHGRGMARQKSHIYKKMSEWTDLSNDWFRSEILDEYVRICKFPNIFLFCAKLDVVKILDYAEANGLFYDILPLCKISPVPFTNNTWLANEYAIHIRNSAIVYNTDYNLKIPYFLLPQIKTTDHPNEKNLDMVKRIVKNITREGDLIFDGFMGSGTTAVACKQLNRHYIGCELNKDIYESSLKRVEGQSLITSEDEPELF